MTAFDYTKTVSLVNRLITKFGRTVTIKAIDKTAEDPTRPWIGSNGQRDILATTVGAFIPVSGYQLGSEWIDAELLKQADLLLLIPGQELALETADTIIDSLDNTEWKVKWCRMLRPGPLRLLFAYSVMR